jgi:protein-S-isoprenylcysteine O-methyltransferase Ste14
MYIIPAPDAKMGILVKTEAVRIALSAARTSQSPTKAFWGTLLFSAGYIAAALACLWQWGSPHPWSRLDIFSRGFFLLMLLWIAASMLLHSSFFRCPEVVQEASGKNFDPDMLIGITVLAMADLLIFLDYGHWRLAPQLEQPSLQWAGLALFLVAGLTLFWADTHLSRHFACDLAERKVISEGPYRFVRHPRYASLLVARVASALIFASVIGWLLAVVWFVLILHRVRLEEAHLRGIFGDDYDAYAARTTRFFPLSLRSLPRVYRGGRY